KNIEEADHRDPAWAEVGISAVLRIGSYTPAGRKRVYQRTGYFIERLVPGNPLPTIFTPGTDPFQGIAHAGRAAYEGIERGAFLTPSRVVIRHGGIGLSVWRPLLLAPDNTFPYVEVPG